MAKLEVGRIRTSAWRISHLGGSEVKLRDVHAGIHEVDVHSVRRPTSTADVCDLVKKALRMGRKLSVGGSRHAMGSQQFGTGTVHLDMRNMRRILGLDSEAGIAHIEAGIEWPDLIAQLRAMQRDRPWSIIQKQTGANVLSVGGALAANAHGRVLARGPIINDVEACLVVDVRGEAIRCSRTENRELFGSVIGGYGLFGIITEVWLRLQRVYQVRREVVEVPGHDAVRHLEKCANDGFTYGDWQPRIGVNEGTALDTGIASTYVPTDAAEHAEIRLGQQSWNRLAQLAHDAPEAAWREYKRHYLSTAGQVYASDTHQTAYYLDGYHAEVTNHPGSEMISELYVPRARCGELLAGVRKALVAHKIPFIYGSLRLIEQDRESRFPWARQDWACLVVNVHVDPRKIPIAKEQTRRLLDVPLSLDGSFFLTYHRWASPEQLRAAYPDIDDFVARKEASDPHQVLSTDWYCWLKESLA